MASNPIAQTRYGKLEGVLEDDIQVFRGIPYAAPPVGNRRWLPPSPPEPWSGVRPARQFGAACPQPVFPSSENSMGSIMSTPSVMDEDCLYLNVWTPGSDGAAHPVMVWIHGGGYELGTAGDRNVSTPIYDGSRLARRGDVVVVTIHYRLGAFGFVHLAGPTGGAIPATGNEGMLDMAAALEWIRDNIEEFGGDPTNVTVFGQSAGGGAVTTLLAMPLAKGLFHKAIVQCGGPWAVGMEHAASMGAELIRGLDVPPNDAEALRKFDATALVQACPSILTPAVSLDSEGTEHVAADSSVATAVSVVKELACRFPRPVIDGDIVPRGCLDAVAAGAAASIPMLIGNNRDEFGRVFPGEFGFAELPQILETLPNVPPGLDLTTLIDIYRHAREERSAGTSPGEIGAAIGSDSNALMPNSRLLEAQREHQADTYSYQFTWTSPAGEGLLGAIHALDIGFVFGTYAADEEKAAFFGQGPAAEALSLAMMDAWSAFARTGNPSCEALGEWPAYGDARRTMLIGERTHVVDDPQPAEREAWKSYRHDEWPGQTA